jgi:hypothetical protein
VHVLHSGSVNVFVITNCNTLVSIFETFLLNVKLLIFQFLVPPHEKAEYPMFVFCEGRSRDVMTINRYSISDDTVRYSDVNVDTDDELECEEFEIL